MSKQHVEDDELYALFWALMEHQQGRIKIEKLELPDALRGAVESTRPEKFSKPPAGPDRVRDNRVRKLVKHIGECTECEIKLCEDGPAARRRMSEDERDAAAEAAEAERGRMVGSFFINLGYGLGCFGGAYFCIQQYRQLEIEKRDKKPQLTGTQKPEFALHPLQIAFGVLVLIAAWGLAEAWRLAGVLWIDWNKAKGAVPLVGKRWAARSLRKQEERAEEYDRWKAEKDEKARLKKLGKNK